MSRTFQEYLLSPRTLLLGHKNLMYQCTQFFYDELLGPLGINHASTTTSPTPDLTVFETDTDLRKSKYFPTTLSALPTTNLSSDPCAPLLSSFLRDWVSLINEYRARDLSFAKDRIIAVAGVARAFAHLGGLTYLAGMWKECFPIGLLWHVTTKPFLLAQRHNGIEPGVHFEWVVQVRESVDTGGEEQQVPSWSFFSVPIHTFHHLALLFGDDEVSAKRKSMRDEARVCFDNVWWCRLLGFRWKGLPEGQVPAGIYNDFTGLRLTLSTKMLPVSVGLATDFYAHMSRLTREVVDPADRACDCNPIFRYYPDDILNGGAEPPRNTVFALVADVQIVRPAGKYTVQRCLMSLVLSPGEEIGTWRRVGVWKLQLRISGIEVTGGNMNAVARRWRGYNVLSEKWADREITLV
jgi:hypothetical protein